MKSSVFTAVLLRDGTTQSKALELRKVALVLCFSPGTQTPFMYCGDGSEEILGHNWSRLSAQLYPTFPHLQSGGVAAEVRRVDEAKAEDSDAATVEGSDVTQSSILQIGQLHWLA